MSGLLVIGTVPSDPGRVIEGRVHVRGSTLTVGDTELAGCQGTAALLLAASAVTERTEAEPPYAVLGGDVGRGEGTRAAYAALPSAVARVEPSVIAFHYLQPTMAFMRRALDELVAMGILADGNGDGSRDGDRGGNGDRIRLVADAGGMYAARAAGVGSRFELMTPDVGEVGFLADASVSHPAYVSRYLFGVEGFDPVALARAAQEELAARVLLVKGRVDHVVEEGEVRARVSEPLVPELEAIGGTGDTVTGLAAALMACGRDTVEAAHQAARANRIAGALLGARPDHGPADLARRFPEALDETGA